MHATQYGMHVWDLVAIAKAQRTIHAYGRMSEEKKIEAKNPQAMSKCMHTYTVL